jgi:integrase
MASLQARHQSNCGLGRAWSTADDAKNCGCKATYYIVHGGGKHQERVGRNRREAERALKVIEGQVASGTFKVPENKRFEKWAPEWLARHTGRESTRENSATTLRYAVETFGGRNVRDLRPSDVSRFIDHIRDEVAHRTPKGRKPHKVAPATLAKHLRQLGACLEDAIAEGYATENPVRQLPSSQRPRVEDPEANYFTDAELSRLWPALAHRPVYLALCKTAVATGARVGELVALEWSDVDFLERKMRVTKSYRNGRTTAPKSKRSKRTVNLTGSAASVLEQWNADCGGPDTGLVFEREEGGEIQNEHLLRRVLYPAMLEAGVDRIGERGGKRTFHSFRDTFARITLENGQPLQWVSRQLGHSSTAVTDRHYGEWARNAEQEQADKLPAGAFPV